MPGRAQPLRIGSVSYLNAKPLIAGLEDDPGVRLLLDVPSRLLDGLRDHRLDVALLPVIDYQRLPGLQLIPAGGICCDGPTFTVRIFSTVPIEAIRTLACDTDSHSSVALASILLAERHGTSPRLVDLTPASAREADAILLIGDKVIQHRPAHGTLELDLGQEWKQMTGLPFVFAAWMARGGTVPDDLPMQLAEARRRGVAGVETIISRFAPLHGWPAELARTYLTRYLQYEITDRHLEAIRRFHALAAEHGLLEHPPWDLTVGRLQAATREGG